MLLRRFARPLLASVFISSGVAVLREPKQHAERAAPVLEPAMDLVAGILPIEQTPEPSTLIQIDAGVKIGAGVLLALGKAPRLAATALAASLVPTTLVEHRFWEMDDPSERAVHQAHFLKDMGLLGGLLLASADTGGKPSLAWRARRARRTSAATAELFHRDVTEGVDELSRRATALGENASIAAGRAGEVAGRRGQELAGRAGDVAGRRGQELAGRATEVAGWAGEAAGRAGGRLTEQTDRLRTEADRLRVSAGQRAEVVRTRAGKRAEKLAAKASKRAEEIASRATKRADEVATLAASRAEQAAKRAEKAGKRARKAGRRASKRAVARAEQLRADLADR
jgi:uncharacterized membrane protein YphA (DoxX/SURF4 family)